MEQLVVDVYDKFNELIVEVHKTCSVSPSGSTTTTTASMPDDSSVTDFDLGNCNNWPCVATYKDKGITSLMKFDEKCIEAGGVVQDYEGYKECTTNIENDAGLLTCKYWNDAIERCTTATAPANTEVNEQDPIRDIPEDCSSFNYRKANACAVKYLEANIYNIDDFNDKCSLKALKACEDDPAKISYAFEDNFDCHIDETFGPGSGTSAFRDQYPDASYCKVDVVEGCKDFDKTDQAFIDKCRVNFD